MGDALRERAGVVVIRDDKVLLVKGRSDYMMPGGAVEPGDSPMNAAARELREEAGLEAKQVEYLFTWDSAINRHHTFRIEAEGEVEIARDEISGFVWWDRKEELSIFGHVEAILERP